MSPPLAGHAAAPTWVHEKSKKRLCCTLALEWILASPASCVCRRRRLRPAPLYLTCTAWLQAYNVRHWTQYPRQTLCPVQQLEATSSLPTSYYYHACSSLASHTVAAAGNRRRARTVRWISMPPARADESMHAPQQARRDADAAT